MAASQPRCGSMSLFKIITFTLWVLIGGLCLLLGIGWPAHLRSVSETSLNHAGRGSLSLSEYARDLIDRGRPGPALQFGEDRIDPAIRARARSLLETRPAWSRTGGSFPILEEALSHHHSLAPSPEPQAVLPALLGSSVRRSLAAQLENSNQRVVHALLELREIGGFTVFARPNLPAGAPLDATILLTAALLESGAVGERLGRELHRLAGAALAADMEALRQLERYFLAMVAISGRLDAQSVALLSSRTESLHSWIELAEWWRSHPEEESLYFAAIALSGDVDSLLRYARSYPDDVQTVIRLSLASGEDSIRFALASQKPLHTPLAVIAIVERGLAQHLLSVRVHRFFLDRPGIAFLIKFFFLFAAVYCLFSGLARLLPNRGDYGLSPPTSAEKLARRTALAIIPAFALWMVIEPRVLQPIASDPPPPPTLSFASFDPIASLSTPMTTIIELDQVTLLILLLFFILQLVIYIFCLIKLAEIQRHPVPHQTKLSLLENEDQLFDLGLYVGLAGTVAALITLSIGIVEASLMMAYASTLLGILFVAFLKIMHVRPLKRRLLLEMQQNH